MIWSTSSDLWRQIYFSSHLLGDNSDQACTFLRIFLAKLIAMTRRGVVNTAIHHVLILPLVGHFKDKSLAFTFASQNELMTVSGNPIFRFPDSVQLTCPTHAGGK
ncbi:hypothetical protein DSO57_1029272 [Entomophthora muscae]|uniref:Uncharacterized protein n=1 Tax=Entomophthora muscae TaxID=34485 RepID=A0ACC2TZQ6_9FUNG|nr:hypothetical protein DSO57_1029272 [Entomophthora muscae]